jgi:hypothetical protein
MDEVLKQIAALRADLKEEFKSGLASVESKLGENTSSLHSINSWRSGVDAQVSDLTASLEAVRKQVDRVVVSVGLSALGAPPDVAATPRPPAPPDASAKSRELGSGQLGHGVVYFTGGETTGHVIVPLSTPVTGTETTDESLALVTVSPVQSTANVSSTKPLPPPTDFPRFDGENPRLWQRAAEKYFRLFSVDNSHRVEYATMHFAGAVAMWLNTMEDQLSQLTWEQLCDNLSRQFDRGQYQMLYRQMVKLKQTGFSVEYIEKFNTLKHHMLEYKSDIDPTFFVTCFIEGLVKDIRVVVMIKRPQDLDTVVSLALFQEEIDADTSKLSPKQQRSRQFSRQSFSPTFRQPISNTPEAKPAHTHAKVSALKALHIRLEENVSPVVRNGVQGTNAAQR